MEELFISKVPRALDLKNKLFGFELGDLLLIFLNLSLSNMLFGASEYRYSLVWGTTLAIAFAIYFAKRGRPDGFIQHWFQYHLSQTYFFAGRSDFSFKEFKHGAIHVRSK
jgi:hypothetical protein